MMMIYIFHILGYMITLILSPLELMKQLKNFIVDHGLSGLEKTLIVLALSLRFHWMKMSLFHILLKTK